MVFTLPLMPKAKKNDNRAEDLKWGTPKKQKAFLLTDEASDLVDDAAVKLGTTRSEALEQLIRFAAPLSPDFLQPSPSPKTRSRGGSNSYHDDQGILTLETN